MASVELDAAPSSWGGSADKEVCPHSHLLRDLHLRALTHSGSPISHIIPASAQP